MRPIELMQGTDNSLYTISDKGICGCKRGFDRLGPRALSLMYWDGWYVLCSIFVFQFHFCLFIFSFCLVP